MSEHRCCPSCGMPLLLKIENSKRDNHALCQNKSLCELLACQVSQWLVVMDPDTSEWLFTSHNIDKAMANPECEGMLRQWLQEQAVSIGNRKEICNAKLNLPGYSDSQYYSVSIHPMNWRGRNALAFVFTDERKEREQLTVLQSLFHYDMLTQVYNRQNGMYILEKWLSENRSFILCFADIDNLKHVNDQFGHSEGDRYIIRISKTLQEFSPNAVICRIGGDEFLLLSENQSFEDAKMQMERLRTRLANFNDHSGVSYESSISYGIVQVGNHNNFSASELLSIADEEMYEYKRAYKMKCKNKLA